jgi:hypothetical protein
MRRALLALTAVIGLGLAGCSGSGGGDSSPSGTSSSADADSGYTGAIPRDTPPPTTADAVPSIPSEYDAYGCSWLTKPRDDGSPFLVYVSDMMHGINDGTLPAIPAVLAQILGQLDLGDDKASPELIAAVRQIAGVVTLAQAGGSLQYALSTLDNNTAIARQLCGI